jgi:hypothetical protein
MNQQSNKWPRNYIKIGVLLSFEGLAQFAVSGEKAGMRRPGTESLLSVNASARVKGRVKCRVRAGKYRVRRCSRDELTPLLPFTCHLSWLQPLTREGHKVAFRFGSGKLKHVARVISRCVRDTDHTPPNSLAFIPRRSTHDEY